MARKTPQRKLELIVAAKHFFYTKGYEDTSVNDLIRLVGVSKGAFYHYFDSKESVLEAVIESLMIEVILELQAIVNSESLSIFEKLQRIIQLSYKWKKDQGREYAEVGRVLRKNENLLLFHKLKITWLNEVVPEIAKIIELGVKQRVFRVKHISEMSMVLITVISTINDEIASLSEKGEKQTIKEEILQKIMAMQEAIENLLGLDNGSMNIADEIFIDSWLI